MRWKEGPKSRARLAHLLLSELAGTVHSGLGPCPGAVGEVGHEQGSPGLGRYS